MSASPGRCASLRRMRSISQRCSLSLQRWKKALAGHRRRRRGGSPVTFPASYGPRLIFASAPFALGALYLEVSSNSRRGFPLLSVCLRAVGAGGRDPTAGLSRKITSRSCGTPASGASLTIADLPPPLIVRASSTRARASRSRSSGFEQDLNSRVWIRSRSCELRLPRRFLAIALPIPPRSIVGLPEVSTCRDWIVGIGVSVVSAAYRSGR